MTSTPSVVDWLRNAVHEVIAARKQTPTSTYRLQFGPQFTFKDATAILDYLQTLGISHVYCSPFLKARPGSTHGYDVVHHQSLDSAIGSDEEFGEFIRELHHRGLGLLLDFVPNHMGIDTDANAWWNDVLEHGQSSPYGRFFDVDWNPEKEQLKNKILLPVLGEQYGGALENGVLSIELDAGAFYVRCYDKRLPVDPKSTTQILTDGIDRLREELPADSPALLELESIVTALENLPNRRVADSAKMDQRQRETVVVKRRLNSLVAESPEIAQFLQNNLAKLNGDPGRPESFDLLDEFLDKQVYRLAHWKVAGDEINYRRFFDVNELAAICMEEQPVFDQAHQYVLQLLARGAATGLRIDHIDGLYDPREYLWRLQHGYVQAIAADLYDRFVAKNADSPAANAPCMDSLESLQLPAIEDDAAIPDWEEIEETLTAWLRRDVKSKTLPWSEHDSDRDPTPVLVDALPLYVLVEKILGAEEQISPCWPVAGTTGYEVLNQINGLFVDEDGFKTIERNYRQWTSTYVHPEDIVYECKRLILRIAMSSELNMLGRQLDRLSEQHRKTRDFTLNSLRDVLREIMSCSSVYRTYVADGVVSQADRKMAADAIRAVRRRNPTLERSILYFVAEVMSLQLPAGSSEHALREAQHFVQRLQQLMGPVTAKGVEDTAFYRYVPLVSLNEVGAHFGKRCNLDEFHKANAARHRSSMTTTSTHDTKRSEDVRARLNVLSETPDRWREHVQRCMELNAPHRRQLEDGPAPSVNDEYLFYQSALGVWPLHEPTEEERQCLVERLKQYMIKAIHEAKLRTSWIDPDQDYDDAVAEFVVKTLEPGSDYLAELQAMAELVSAPGLLNGLSQTLLKFTAPGTPDTYQGQELWDFSLVDPDNRRPVDYEMRRRLLREVQELVERSGQQAAAAELVKDPRDPRLKLYVTKQALEFRRRFADLLHVGEYIRIDAVGAYSDRLCCFGYDDGRQSAVIVAPVRWMGLLGASASIDGQVWDDASIPLPNGAAAPWKDLFTGRLHEPLDGGLAVATLLSEFPVALLTRETP